MHIRDSIQLLQAVNRRIIKSTRNNKKKRIVCLTISTTGIALFALGENVLLLGLNALLFPISIMVKLEERKLFR